jgi:hypothetical protein
MIARRPFALLLVLTLTMIIAAGCGGVGPRTANATPTPTPIPSPTPSPTPSSAGLSASPSSLSFGNLAVNGSSSQTVKVTNTGTAAITITQDTITGSAFSTGLTTPMSLNAGQSANVSVVFSPKAAGTASGSLLLASNTTASLTIALSGNGVNPTAHSVDVSWAASTSSNVQGYNVYRGLTSGGPYTKISPTLSASTLAFTDASPVSGTNYFYVVTAVDSNGLESAASNQVSVTIPTP